MKIAFSTIGCPNYSWTDIYPMAADLGFDGIEIRGLGNFLMAAKAQPFTDAKLPNTMAKLSEIGVEICCFTSGCALADQSKREENIAEITQYIELARKTSTPFVRLMGEDTPGPNPNLVVDDDYMIELLKELAAIAHADTKPESITLILETNGVYADTSRLARVLDAVDSENIAALWDIHHPYRFFDESPATTIANLGSRIKYVHAKDSCKTAEGKIEYRMMGEGDMPLREMFDGLAEIGYEGYITLEWVKRWAPYLTDSAIVFPHFANFMRDYFSEMLQTAKSGLGKYIWKKEQLIDLTFPELLDRIVKQFPDQWAFRYTELDYNRTYSEFRDDVDTFARALIAMGVKKGDNVAIWATNVPQWYITFWATTKIGAVLVTVNSAYKVHEAEYLFRQSDTHTLVMIPGFKDCDYIATIQELCPELEHCEPGKLQSKRLPRLRNVIVCDQEVPGCYSWTQALAKASETPISEVYARMHSIDKHDVCNMQYTSGTTGFPKGVMLTHYNVVNNGKAIGDCMDLSTGDRMMIQVPMFHCFGMVLAMTASVVHGTTMCPITAFSPRKGLHCINQEKITCFHGVPTMFIAMLGHEDFPKTDFSYMRTGIMAGSPCPIKVMEDVVEKMHMPEICITYGQTEASPATTMSKTTDSLETRVNTVGGPIFGVECKIVDPETGEEVPDNVDGEFCARGYNIMKGYYKMPEATAAVIDEDGWLHSGDLLRRLPDGNFKVTGRIKDMIIRGGENIYPKEIEDFLYTCPDVNDVQVIGVPSEAYGEEVMACIVLEPGSTATEEDILEFCRTRIAKHKVPRYIRFVDEFPMNAAGKILKYQMRDEAVEYLKLHDAANIETA